MLSVKPIVYKAYRRADGLFPIKIRVTWQRQSKYFDTPLTATAKQLTAALDGIRDARLCSSACKVADGIRQTLNDNAAAIRTMADIVRILKGETQLPSVADYYGKVCQQMEREGRQHTAANYRTSLARLNQFAPGITFDAVTVPWLRAYEKWLSERMGTRGVQMYLSCLRRVYNAAYEEFCADGTERIRRSPFAIYHIPEPAPTKKRALTIEQMRQIVSHSPADALSAFAKDVFLLSFMFCGINTVDLFSLEGLTADRLTYNRSKTKGKRRDGALISIAIQPQAAPLVAKYRSGKRFNFSRTYKNDYTLNQAVNKGLKKIGAAIGVPGLQYYAARHSWATIARNDCNVAMDDVALALCHARNTVTDIYVRPDYSRIDRANEKVLSAVFCQSDKQPIFTPSNTYSNG
jgi:site-specific recombinase XerD